MERRVVKLTLRLSQDEHQQIREAAFASRLRLADFIRTAALGQKIHPAPPAAPALNLEAWQALARTNGNLNQMAHHLNEGRVVVTRALALEAIDMMTQMGQQVAALRCDLVGAGGE